MPTTRGFVLTHNRDEAPGRSPDHISRHKIGSGELIFPRDLGAKGSWIAASTDGKLACLLNGAFVKHRHEPPYRRSRGLVLLDFFEHGAPEDFFEKYPLDGIEPFTFLFFQKILGKDFQKHQAVELRWDGAVRHLQNLPADAPHFWCSSTLYPPEMQARREQVFRDWLAENFSKNLGKKRHSPARAALQLHRTGSVGDPENDFVMNRNGRVQTVSMTQVVVDQSVLRMRYLDLLGGSSRRRRLVLTI